MYYEQLRKCGGRISGSLRAVRLFWFTRWMSSSAVELVEIAHHELEGAMAMRGATHKYLLHRPDDISLSIICTFQFAFGPFCALVRCAQASDTRHNVAVSWSLSLHAFRPHLRRKASSSSCQASDGTCLYFIASHQRCGGETVSNPLHSASTAARVSVGTPRRWRKAT